MMYLVIDCSYNREYYLSLIGKKMSNPPSNAMATECRK